MRLLHRLVVTGLLGLATTPGTAADSLGRLFMTPEQRQALDSAREPGGEATAGAAVTAGTGAVPVGRQVVLNGVVRRSHGPDVVWINGTRASAAGGQPVQLRRGPDKSNRVTLEDADGTVARLKPGQYWIPATGQVADCYGCAAAPKATDLVAPAAPLPAPSPSTAPSAAPSSPPSPSTAPATAAPTTPSPAAQP